LAISGRRKELVKCYVCDKYLIDKRDWVRALKNIIIIRGDKK
jgi:hypothetical protein